MRWQRIRSIQFVGHAPYYDLTVPGAANYLAQGIWHHNCGKSSGVVIAILGRMEDQVVDGVMYRPKLPDNSRILVFGPSYPQMRQGTIKTFDKFFDESGYVLKKIDGNEPERRLERGITVYFRNASNPEQTRSHETTLVWLDEFGQMRDDVLTLCNASQRQWGSQFQYQTYITSTPRGRNHFYRRFKKQIESPDNDDEEVGFYHTTTQQAIKDGVDLPTGYVENMGYVEGSEMWRQEIEGDFVSWAGLVFNQFNAQRHCPDPFILPDFKRVYGGIDVGYGGITSMVLIGLDQKGAMYTFREYYQKRAQAHDWMALAGEWTKEYKVRQWYIDSAANLEYRAMRTAGLPVHQSMKAKDAAGSAVGYINSKFARDEFFIDRDRCPFLVMELETYQYKELLSGDEVTFLDKTKPNQPDHALDALRYGCLPLSSAMAHSGSTYRKMKYG